MEQFEELNLKRLAEIVFKHIGMIIAFTLIAGILAFIYSETMIVPEYESSVTVIVNNQKNDNKSQILSSDISASKMLVNTYVVIIKSDTVLGEVSGRLYEEKGLEYSISTLKRMIKASSVDDTEIFKIVVRDTNRQHTMDIANVIAEVVPERIQSYVEASSVKIIDYAGIGGRVAPNVQTNMLIGLAVGLFLSCAFVILREIFDMRIKNEEELEQWFKIPILGVIPDILSDQLVNKPGYYSYRRYSGAYEYDRKGEDGDGGQADKSKSVN